MSNEEKRKSGGQMGTLGGCLIEGDSEQKVRERRIKRRALAISIAFQSLVLVALVLTPLLGKTEKLPFAIVTPMPPYRAVRPHATADHPAPPAHPRPTGFIFPTKIPPTIVTQETQKSTDVPTGSGEPNLNDSVPVPGIDGGTGMFDKHGAPTPPGDPDRDKKKRIVVGSGVQQALLTHRVEPCFPPLARQIRRGGQVRLHAVISMDGTVESLQLMDGDPLFVQCARDAVRQWRYRPTSLNGVPVEVETVITVIYTLNQ
jgi:protein TonB